MLSSLFLERRNVKKRLLVVVSSFLWASASTFAEPPSIVEVGTLDTPAPGSKANGVSGDGAVVVGETNMPGGNTVHAFRWTAAGGMTDLGTIGGAAGSSRAFGASKTGDVVVGTSPTPSGSNRAFRWTSSTGPVDLGTIGGVAGSSSAAAVSADGNVIVGIASSPNGLRPYRFASSTMTDLGPLSSSDIFVGAVSDDGSVVAGSEIVSFLGTGWRWTSETGIEKLVPPAGDLTTFALGLSGDGSTIVGVTGGAIVNPMTWTQADGMQKLNPTSAQANDASANAQVLVGHATSGGVDDAMVWIDGEPTQLAALLASQGVDLSEWSALKKATAVSSNGRVIVGIGTFIPLNCEMGFRAVLLNEPPTVEAPQPTFVECTGDGTTVVLAAAVDDIDTPTLTVEWRVNGTLQKTEQVSAGTTASFTFAYPDGESAVTIDVKDGDNVVQDGTSVTVSDTTSPVVIVAPNVKLRVDQGQIFASRSRLPAPSVTDICDEDPTVVNDARLKFPVGLHVVRWTATDADGNSASVTQNVKVFNDPPKAKAGRDIRLRTSSKTAKTRLDGTASFDKNGHRLKFSWSARGIPFVNGDRSKPTGTFPVGTTTVKLTVIDSLGARSTDTVRVIVRRAGGQSASAASDAYAAHAYVEAREAVAGSSSASAASGYRAAEAAYALGSYASATDDAWTNDELRYAQSLQARSAGDQFLRDYLAGGTAAALSASVHSYYGSIHAANALAE